MSSLEKLLKERLLIDTVSSDQVFASSSFKIYHGIDPTAPSLHIGNLVGLVVLKWLQRFGCTPYILLGGATAKIGDPSGKSKERPILSVKEIEANTKNIRQIISTILAPDKGEQAPIFVNNNDWFEKMTFVDVLRDVGRYFRLGPMLGKESVKQRLQSEEGISFTEFSYQLLQGYDFYHLYLNHGVTHQVGGSDQWGNITAGIDFVRKMTKKPVYGFSYPLLTNRNGKKFGKTEEGAIWLSSDHCSYYNFYQSLFRVHDDEVVAFLKKLTFLPIEEINNFQQMMGLEGYVPNTLQNTFAEVLTKFIHHENGVQIAQKVTSIIAPGSKAILNPQILDEVSKDFPTIGIKKQEIIGKKYQELASISKLLPSKSEGIRLLKNRGAYVNNHLIESELFTVEESDLVGGQYCLLGAGKKKKILFRVTD